MQTSRQPLATQWVIATFSKPLLWHRNADEVWMLNPPRRYLINAHNLDQFTDHIESISDLSGAANYRPLQAGKSIAGARILVERMRERGIGDILFMTGPMNFLNHVCGNQVKLDFFALSDRGMILQNHAALHLGTTFAGPLEYDHLPLYNYHWMVNSVTECNEEPDQLNVYDALYAQLGFSPGDVDARFKRPTAELVAEDWRNFDQALHFIFCERKLDLRRTGYYIVAPLSHSNLRSAPYSMWLSVIQELAARRPVIVVGMLTDRMPRTDMTAGEFNQKLTTLGASVINMLGGTSIRILMSFCAKATCVFSLDSGPLYIAEAFRTPAVSLWGSHDPGVRLGYDKDYMDLAVWNQAACNFSPCYAYAQFPVNKCPSGAGQEVCQVQKSIEVNDVLKKLDMVESGNRVLSVFAPK